MRSPPPAATGTLAATIWIILALACAVFGWMAVDHVSTLRSGEPSVWARVQALLVSDAYSFGAGSTHLLMEAESRPYRVALTQMSWHMGMGGVLLVSGLLQFVPPLRRRWQRLHRAIGALFIATCLVSMGSALWYLARTPFELVYSGRTFAAALTAQALTVLGGLLLAVTAIRARDFHSHMGWMALSYGVILSAPMLRIEWALLGALLPMTQEQVNLGVTATLNFFSVLPMAIWLATFGAREFSPRAPGLRMPPRLLRVLAVIAGITVIHEGVAVPLGFDVLADLRAPGMRLPLVALPWCVASLVALLLMPAAWRAAERGARIGWLPTLAALAVAAGAGAIALAPVPADPSLVESVQPLFWGGYAAALLVLVGLAWLLPPQPQRHEPWSVQLQMLLLSPALWMTGAAPLYLLGFPFEEALAAGMTLSLGGGAGFGFALAYNLRVYLPGHAARAANPLADQRRTAV